MKKPRHRAASARQAWAGGRTVELIVLTLAPALWVAALSPAWSTCHHGPSRLFHEGMSAPPAPLIDAAGYSAGAGGCSTCIPRQVAHREISTHATASTAAVT